MTSKADSEKQKLIQDKCQIILGNLLREEDNKYCVDCDAKGPRWASWNLGVFLCIRCAGIHRNLGVHISKVKSVNLDTWTPEQVANHKSEATTCVRQTFSIETIDFEGEQSLSSSGAKKSFYAKNLRLMQCLQQMGNSQARAVYEANLPESFRRPQTDSSLEAFIRAKYEQKKYIAKEWVPPPAPKPAFDIEEEKRKEREKKKSRSKVSAVIEIPALPQHPTALPRPHSTGPHSPSSKPVHQDPSKSNAHQVPGTDLLNLGEASAAIDDNIFDAFLSAPVTSVPEKSLPTTQTIPNVNAVPPNSVSNDEADFFSQKSEADVNQTNKMTKESILSLYGSNACQIPVTQHIAPVYGVSGGMYLGQPAYSQVGMSGFQAPNPGGINTCNTGANVSAVYNPFASFGASSVRQDSRTHPNVWIGGRDESLIVAHGLGQVSQQMANLQISGQTWNVGVSPGPINTSGLIINSTQAGTGVVWPSSTNSQSLSNNLWQ